MGVQPSSRSTLSQISNHQSAVDCTETMRRYELVEDGQRLFWEIELFDRHFDVREGVADETSRTRQWDFLTPERTRAEYRKHIDWRERAGFALVHSDPADDAIVDHWLSELRALANPELEAEIALHPDAPDAWLVYGDWLEAGGSVRGELVQVQAALAMRPDDAALREREGTLLMDHERAWLGDLADLHDAGFSCTWRFGFLSRVELRAADVEEARQWYGMLAALPAARLLRELRIQAWDRDSNDVLDTTTLLDPASSSILRKLQIECHSVDVVLGDLHAGVLPKLEELEIAAKTLHVRAMARAFPSLRTLVLKLRALEVEPDAIASSEWTKLERLELAMSERAPKGRRRRPLSELPRQPELLDAILAQAPKLRSLAMRIPSWADDVIATLAGKVEVARRLHTLDVSGSSLSEAGARMLLDHASDFAHMTLDLRYNRLAPDLCDALASRFRRAKLGDQDRPPTRAAYEYDDVDE
jgi:uncharacterized protein (TIGR02996 family)